MAPDPHPGAHSSTGRARTHTRLPCLHHAPPCPPPTMVSVPPLPMWAQGLGSAQDATGPVAAHGAFHKS